MKPPQNHRMQKIATYHLVIPIVASDLDITTTILRQKTITQDLTFQINSQQLIAILVINMTLNHKEAANRSATYHKRKYALENLIERGPSKYENSNLQSKRIVYMIILTCNNNFENIFLLINSILSKLRFSIVVCIPIIFFSFKNCNLLLIKHRMLNKTSRNSLQQFLTEAAKNYQTKY